MNAGTAPARAVELAAQLPPGMKFVRANNAGWDDEHTHRVLWNLEELPPGETGTVEVGGVTEYIVRVGNQGTKPATSGCRCRS